MKRFRFRLERLLKIRAALEREWQIRFAEKLGICIRLERRIEESIQESRRSFLAAGSDLGFDLGRLYARDLYVSRLAGERLRMGEELAAGRREMEKVREKYLEASRERKILDKLKERRQVEHRAGERKEELKVVDDMNNARRARSLAVEG